MWSGPDGLCDGLCAVAARQRWPRSAASRAPGKTVTGTVAWGCAWHLARFFLTGCEDCTPISLKKVLEVKRFEVVALAHGEGDSNQANQLVLFAFPAEADPGPRFLGWIDQPFQMHKDELYIFIIPIHLSFQLFQL